ncbi:SDR family NAD(P)-dependent oxidoreductase [Mangrovitalea sediminis]|uniref:SDR family NAD(P)-dependent oxidoreductase n=1 Tax=Mangrovitalea sediminis TaxID=1982043 RepID=UPI000BE53345|nr:SDR family oxidoreductase [Mangrovitalea sediminis]
MSEQVQPIAAQAVPPSLQGRRALVTGTAGGIGGAIAQALVARGAWVHGLDRDGQGQARLRATIDVLHPPGRFLPYQVDIADPLALDGMLAELAGTVLAEGCDILVNAAGISRTRKFEESDDALLDSLFAVNFRAAFRITRALVPMLKNSGRASVINVASELALIGQPLYSAYSASKGAMLSWTRALAVELGRCGVRVNAVCPGPVDTAMLAAEFEATESPVSARKAEIATVPLGHLGAPADIASVVAFLASDEAGFVNGAVWPVDGGKTAA